MNEWNPNISRLNTNWSYTIWGVFFYIHEHDWTYYSSRSELNIQSFCHPSTHNGRVILFENLRHTLIRTPIDNGVLQSIHGMLLLMTLGLVVIAVILPFIRPFSLPYYHLQYPVACRTKVLYHPKASKMENVTKHFIVFGMLAFCRYIRWFFLFSSLLCVCVAVVVDLCLLSFMCHIFHFACIVIYVGAFILVGTASTHLFLV